MTTYQITIVDDEIRVTAPVNLIPIHRAIGLGVCAPDGMTWRYPAVAPVAEILERRMPASVARSDAFRQLAQGAIAEAEQSERVRFADDLEQPVLRGRDLWKHQLQAYHFACNKDGVLLAMDMGCIDGQAVVVVNRGGGSKQMAVAFLHYKLSGSAPGRSRIRWDSRITTRIRSLKADGTVGLATVLLTKATGVRECLTIVLANRTSITCTLDHDMVTPTGKQKASTLSVGDVLLSAPLDYQEPIPQYDRPLGNRTADGKFLDKDGYIHVWGTGHHRESAGGIYEHILVAEHTLGRALVAGEEVHHKDHNRANNDPGNLLVGLRGDHKRLHTPRHRLPGTMPQPSAIVSIERAGSRMVYDVGVDDEAHTWIANEVVVGNTGKTTTAIALVQNDPHANRVLILCPLKVATDPGIWPGDLQKNMVLPYTVKSFTKGTVAQRAQALRDWLNLPRKNERVFAITNYDSIRADSMLKTVERIHWDYIICDEAHKLKQASGVTSRHVAAIAKKVTKKILLTGTPMPHSPLDVYGQFRIISPEIYGKSFVAFRNRYAVLGGFEHRTVLGYQNMDDFNRRLFSVTYQVGKEVLDLPPEHHITRTCFLGAKQSHIYSEMRDELMVELEQRPDDPIMAQNILVKLLRLQQVTGGHIDGTKVGNEKADLLAEVLDSLPQDEPVVVFCKFVRDLDAVREVARSLGRTSSELSGRVNELQQWKASETDVLAVQMQAGGVGIDLTRAAYCIYYSTGYSLGDMQQSLARVHRPGQTRPVTYVHLHARLNNERVTVDHTIARALANKKKVVDAVMNGEILGEREYD